MEISEKLNRYQVILNNSRCLQLLPGKSMTALFTSWILGVTFDHNYSYRQQIAQHCGQNEFQKQALKTLSWA